MSSLYMANTCHEQDSSLANVKVLINVNCTTFETIRRSYVFPLRRSNLQMVNSFSLQRILGLVTLFTKTLIRGTGIGLFISKTLVKKSMKGI